MKISNIYALQGEHDIGKSTTLKLVFEKLKNQYKINPTQINYLSSPNKRKDITVILTGIKGEIIGIESAGDDFVTIEISLNQFEKAGCTIIFCACRSRGQTVTCINRHTKYTSNFIQQETHPEYTKSQQDQNNDLMAQIMIKTVGL